MNVKRMNPGTRGPALLRIAAMAALIASVACGGDSVTDPLFEPEVANLADNFQFQATAVSNVTQTVTYNWQNSGATANVDQSGAITGGTAALTIRDAAGDVVYDADLTSTGSFTSSAGTSGTWTIQLVLNHVSGNLNFRVQKP